MRVTVVGRTYMVQANQAKWDYLPKGIDLTVLLLKRLLGYRVIFFTWENIVSQFPGPFRWLHRLNLALMDGAIAGNTAAARLLPSKGFRQPIAVIPQLGVNPETFTSQQGEHMRHALGLTHFTVGYIGRLALEKGLNIFLKALVGLESKWQALVVGRGPQRQEMEQQAHQLDISSHLRWIDTVSHNEVVDYLNAVDVLVLPSLSTSRWQEQLGRILIEAMPCGVPVIGSDSGAIPEVIGDAGFIFPEGNVNVLTQYLRCLREDSSLRQQMGQRGRERVFTYYTHQRLAEYTAAFWQEVCSCV